MKTTKGAAYDASMTINRLIESPDQDVPQTVAYRLSKIYAKIKRIGVEVERFMMEKAQEFGQERKGPNGESYGWEVPEGEQRKKYNDAIGVLRDEEIDVDVTPIPIAAFGTRHNGLNVNQYHHLGDFIVGEIADPQEAAKVPTQLGTLAAGQDH